MNPFPFNDSTGTTTTSGVANNELVADPNADTPDTPAENPVAIQPFFGRSVADSDDFSFFFFSSALYSAVTLSISVCGTADVEAGVAAGGFARRANWIRIPSIRRFEQRGGADVRWYRVDVAHRRRSNRSRRRSLWNSFIMHFRGFECGETHRGSRLCPFCRTRMGSLSLPSGRSTDSPFDEAEQ